MFSYRNVRKFDSQDSKPLSLVPVIAHIQHQYDLGISNWTEVICYNKDKQQWEGYYGGTKFKDGETVISWAYVHDIFENLRPSI
jgi:hypothetical protein